MKRLIILLALLVLCSPVLAWSNSLNNQDIPLYFGGASDGYGAYVVDNADGMRYAVYVADEPTRDNWVAFPNGSVSATYMAYTLESPYGYDGRWGIGTFFIQSGGSIFNGAGAGKLPGRIEIVKSGTNAYIYCDGVPYTTASIGSTSIYSFAPYISNDGCTYQSCGSGGFIVDDPSFGNAQSDTCIVSVQPHTWYILHDYLNANHFGQYDSSNNLISTTAMNLKWSIGAQNDGWSIASPPDDRYIIKVQAPSGVIAYNEYVNITAAGHAFGYVNLSQNKTHIGNQPFEYGIYFVTLYDGTSVRSTDYFRVLAANAGSTITWDRNVYTSSDTATVTYLVDPAYYDAATYTYALSVKNIYGVEVATYPLTTSSGTVSVPLSGYTQGVHYGQLVITQITAPTNIGILASSPMEISAYDVFNGYVMNAENGTVISGATVDISQSVLNATVTTNAAGAYLSSSNWLVGSATTIATTKTGFTSDSLSFTPIASKNITVNISLVPDPATTNGISIGGVVRDKTYHNPVPGANYIVRNSTMSYQGITNIAGFARTDYLTNGVLYDVWSSKTGFSNSTVTQRVAVST